MKNDILKRIIKQLRKYRLIGNFSSIEQFNNWLSNLNSKQINNFLSLDISLEEVKDLRKLLINDDLLNCDDYKKRVLALSTLKNGNGYWQWFDNLCKPNFLKSDNFYRDIDMLSKSDALRHALRILGEDSFINSPYHDDDLKLIIEASDIDFLIADALATVAANKDSINSPYHKEDMMLIYNLKNNCSQMRDSYLEFDLCNLATNKVSLSDKYHLENMKILASSPIGIDYLFDIMTDADIVKGNNYREEVKALLNAKSETTAKAMYCYITNPKNDVDFMSDSKTNYLSANINHCGLVKGSETDNYLSKLSSINEVSDDFVIHHVSLLMNAKFINSEFFEYDLNILKNIKDVKTYMDLYRFITNDNSFINPYHKFDIKLLSEITSSEKRKLLLKKMTDKNCFESVNRKYDLEYIRELNLENIDPDTLRLMEFYLFSPEGINAEDHVLALEQLKRDYDAKNVNLIDNYLSDLEKQLQNSHPDDDIILNKENNKKRILKIFNK